MRPRGRRRVLREWWLSVSLLAAVGSTVPIFVRPHVAWVDKEVNRSDNQHSARGWGCGPENLRPLLATALEALGKGIVDRDGPVPADGPEAVGALLTSDVLPLHGAGTEAALERLAQAFTAGAADPADPACVAHLHTPPLAVAVAAELVASVLNSSLDSWDQATSGKTARTIDDMGWMHTGDLGPNLPWTLDRGA